MSAEEDLPVVELQDQMAWERWLERNHASVRGAWLKFAKQGSGATTVNYGQAVESALCFGWIDGQVKAQDTVFYRQRFTPRRPRSRWSQINRRKAERLIEAGRMRAPGLAAVRAAQADGRWDVAYESPSRARVPEDLQQELDGNPEAERFFATLSSGNRYAILYRIAEAKRPQTRARRIAQYVAMLNEHRTIYP